MLLRVNVWSFLVFWLSRRIESDPPVFFLSVKALLALVAHTRALTSQGERLRHLGLDGEAERVGRQLGPLVKFIEREARDNPAVLEVAARDIALSLAHIYIGTYYYMMVCHHCMLGVVAKEGGWMYHLLC